MSFLSFSYINILGFLLFIVFILQLSSGILSSIYYNDFFTIASDPIIYIIININNGWFIRILHVIGASLFILFTFFHFIRAIWIKLKNIYMNLFSKVNLILIFFDTMKPQKTTDFFPRSPYQVSGYFRNEGMSLSDTAH